MKPIALLSFAVMVIAQTSQAQSVQPQTPGLLDQKLETLYQEVSQKFEVNSWFKNEANPELYSSGVKNLRLPPEFAMPSLAVFKTHMKSYCSLMESPAGKKVARPSHYSVVDYTDDATYRRLYVYDTQAKEFIHNTWTTHGTNSYTHFSLTLKDTSSGYANPVMAFNDELNGVYFSNQDSTNQSSVGMTIGDPKTYWSNTFTCNALRMNGVDGSLNDRILGRAIVVHAFDYRAADIGQYRHVPASWGCVMLQRTGYYKGVPDAPISDLIINDMTGGPILLYHERMNPTANEEAYQSQLQIYADLQQSITDKLKPYSGKYSWSPEQLQQYENELRAKLKTEYLDRVEQTYRYFKAPSKYVGKEPKSAATCIKALNLN